MSQYKYFHTGYRVKIAKDKHTPTTIVASFQKRYYRIFWRTVQEVNFDVFDYAALGTNESGKQERKEAGEQSSNQYVTVSYNHKVKRELWHPKDFDLDKALERHCQKLMSDDSGVAAK